MTRMGYYTAELLSRTGRFLARFIEDFRHGLASAWDSVFC